MAEEEKHWLLDLFGFLWSTFWSRDDVSLYNDFVTNTFMFNFLLAGVSFKRDCAITGYVGVFFFVGVSHFSYIWVLEAKERREQDAASKDVQVWCLRVVPKFFGRVMVIIKLFQMVCLLILTVFNIYILYIAFKTGIYTDHDAYEAYLDKVIIQQTRNDSIFCREEVVMTSAWVVIYQWIKGVFLLVFWIQMWKGAYGSGSGTGHDSMNENLRLRTLDEWKKFYIKKDNMIVGRLHAFIRLIGQRPFFDPMIADLMYNTGVAISVGVDFKCGLIRFYMFGALTQVSNALLTSLREEVLERHAREDGLISKRDYVYIRWLNLFSFFTFIGEFTVFSLMVEWVIEDIIEDNRENNPDHAYGDECPPGVWLFTMAVLVISSLQFIDRLLLCIGTVMGYKWHGPEDNRGSKHDSADVLMLAPDVGTSTKTYPDGHHIRPPHLTASYLAGLEREDLVKLLLNKPVPKGARFKIKSAKDDCLKVKT